MKRILPFLLLLSTLSFAQNDERRVMVNTVSVAADGKFEAEPDTALINFVVMTQEGLSKSAYAKAAEAADRVREVLKANGVDPKIATFGGYSLQPMFDYMNAKRKIVGYRVTSTVELKLKEKDFDKTGPIM